ncbi:DUF5684 domain-containing protein [Pedobacter sp. KR3-3]|uniref:DUF5684 domain-containing protein n=1 Tax=Pedobacter albus TaxID=3113905 RepID=A0ABU7I9G6_9SPHI|nr:DUF5684 domain-containing protein [Pedobacter sp. KR3-3]MEE1946124.1 DUF5684 domain-containing protein [Pedobacter sp. KR3-3]
MDYSSEYSSAGASIFAGIFLTIWLISLVLGIISIAGMWKTFEKAGKPGWAAIIPIYNIYVMIEIVGKPSIWLLWCILPCVNFVFCIWLLNLMSKSYGKSEGFTVGLFFLGFIFWPILGFGDAKYLGPSAAEAQNPFGNNPFNNPNGPFNQPPPPPAPPSQPGV